MPLKKWFKNNDALNWMPESRQEALISEIEKQNSYDSFEQLMTRIQNKEDISAYETLNMAIRITLTADLNIPKDKAVYFSGTTQQKAEEFVANNPEYHLIHTRPAGAMLELLSLFSDDNNLTIKEAYQPWYILATKYAGKSKGNITAIIDSPLPEKTFRSVELDILLNNKQVTHINNKEKSTYSDMITGKSSLSEQFKKAIIMLSKHKKPRPPKSFGM